MDALSPERLLKVWETGTRYHPIDRALLLFSVADPAVPPERLADEPLGRRNAAILRLRQERFAGPVAGWFDCPDCGERLELEIGPDRLPAPPAGPNTRIEVAGLGFRPPTSRDLAVLSHAADPEETARQLLHACAESPDSLPTDADELDTLLNQVDSVLDQQDPWADPALSVTCPACGQETEATLDIAAIVWDEINSLAQQLLDEVHLLAQAYGWRESEILTMSDARRTAYLERLQV
ncbi:MAG: hypothetical protein ABFS23_10520 [Pseudomonadota bacterium]